MRAFIPSRGRFQRAAARTILVLGVLAAQPAQAEDPEITRLRAADRTTFTDAEIFDGFFKTTFGAEFRLEGRTDRIRKYVGPVRVYVDNRRAPDRRAELPAVIADIRARIAHLDIALTEDRASANFEITLVRNRDLASTIRAFFGREPARRMQHSLEPQCLSGYRKDASYRIEHSDVILVVDAGDFIFYDCAYEEILQALGPINDDPTVPWTMFNDDVQKGFFDVYDQYLLNILYHPRIRTGMTKAEVRAVLPQVMPDVRAWVARHNGPAH